MKWENEYKTSKTEKEFIKKTVKKGLKISSARRTYYRLQKELGKANMTTSNGRKVLPRKERRVVIQRASRPLPSRNATTFYKTCNGTPTGKILRITIEEMETMLKSARVARAIAIGVDITEE